MALEQTKSLYSTYMEQAKQKYPSLNLEINPFLSPDLIQKKYKDYNEVQNLFATPFNLTKQDMAELNSSPTYMVEDYLKNDYAISFLNTNYDHYKNLNDSSPYMEKVNANIDYISNLSEEEKVQYYENNMSDLQKNALSLVGIKNTQDFGNTLNAIKFNNSIENGIYSGEVTDQNGVTQKKDVTLAEILKGVATGAATGAAIGTLGTPFGSAVGAIVGGIIGGATELADLISENEFVEGVNNAKRNFVSAVYGSTIGMVGDASAGIANVFNVGISKLADKDIKDIEKYNPLNYIEGMTDGLDNYFISKQKDGYTGFAKFLAADLPSVFGSLTGFAITGNTLGKVFGAGKEVSVGVKGSRTLSQKILNRFVGGSAQELSTRGLVALQAMDQTFDSLKEKGISNEKAMRSSLLNGGLEWSVLSFTEAIPGMRVSGKLTDQFGKFAVKDVLRQIPIEMATEMTEEMSELAAQEISMSLGMGTAEFSSVKDYIYTGFLGAIGGAFGAGLGGLNYRKTINDTYEQLMPFGQEYVNNIKEDFKASGLSELEARDRTIKDLMDKGITSIPQSVLRNVQIQNKDAFVKSYTETYKYVNETLKQEATDIVNSTTDMDSSEKNINKVSFLLNEAKTNADATVRKELTNNIKLYARTENADQLDIVYALDAESKAELNELSQSQFNERMKEAEQKGYNKVYKDLKNVVEYGEILPFMKKSNLTKNDIDTLYSKQLITQKTYADFNNKYDKEMQTVNSVFETYQNNPSKSNIAAVKKVVGTKQDLFNYIQENTTDKKEYLNMIKDFGLDSFDDSYSKMISIGNDIDTVLDYDLKDKSMQTNAEQLQKIKTIKAELKEEYGRLNRVPFEMINELSDNDVTLEKLNELESLLKQEVRNQKSETQDKISKEPLRLIESKGVLSAKSKNDYYNSKSNKEVSTTDKVRQVYYSELSKRVGQFESISSELKEKYNLKDFDDMVMQMVLDEKVKFKKNINIDNMEVKERVTGSYSGQTNVTLSLHDGKTRVGYVEYVIYNNEISIDYINVKESYRKQGIAHKLLSQLQSENEGKQIKFGMTTDDGTKLLDKIVDKKTNLVKPYQPKYGITVYHGTYNNFENFDLKFANTSDKLAEGVGIYFSTVPALAKSYGDIIKEINIPTNRIKNFTNKNDMQAVFDDMNSKLQEKYGYSLNESQEYYGDFGITMERIIDGEQSIDIFREIELMIDADESFWEQDIDPDEVNDFIDQEKEKYFNENLIIYTDKSFDNPVAISKNEKWLNELNKAVVEIQKPNIPSSNNYGVHFGDLGKAEAAFRTGGRSTGHFGTGTYFFSNRMTDKNWENKPKHYVDFEGYNLYKPTTNNKGFELHRTLKEVDDTSFINKTILNKVASDKSFAEDLISVKYGIKKIKEIYYDSDLTLDENIALIDTWRTSDEMKQWQEDHGYGMTSNEIMKEDKEVERFKFIMNTLKNDNYVDRTYSKKENDINGMLEVFEKEINQISDLENETRYNWNLPFNFEQAINAALKANVSYTQRPVINDSASTILMKSIGYDGIDVRALNELDNSTYGSVIYDLKSESELNKKVLEQNVKQDSFIVKDKFNDMDVIGVGIDYVNGFRQNPKIYYDGDQIGEHTFYYDKQELIKQLFKENYAKTLVDENGQTIKCGA